MAKEIDPTWEEETIQDSQHSVSFLIESLRYLFSNTTNRALEIIAEDCLKQANEINRRLNRLL